MRAGAVGPWFDAQDAWLPHKRTGAALWLAVGTAAFIAVTLVPVATFLVLIVCFGLAHVLTELRYVDMRFSARLGGHVVPLILAGIAGIVLARIGIITGVLGHSAGIGIEVSLGLGLALLAATVAQRHRMLIGTGVLAFTLVAVNSPWHALILMALIHNLTPVAFFAEALEGDERRRVLFLIAWPFFLIPLLIATGFPGQAMEALTGITPDWMPFAAGDAERHFASFLPPEVINGPFAMQAFAGAVFAQAMHYWATIAVLPRLGAVVETTPGRVPWPRGVWFFVFVAGASGALALYFLADYTHARSLYGLTAAVHSWLEVPILIAALGGGLRAWSRSSPA